MIERERECYEKKDKDAPEEKWRDVDGSDEGPPPPKRMPKLMVSKPTPTSDSTPSITKPDINYI